LFICCFFFLFVDFFFFVFSLLIPIHPHSFSLPYTPLHTPHPTPHTPHQTLENENARSTWTLNDHSFHITYSGSAEPADLHHHYYTLYIANKEKAFLCDMAQLNLQKVNTDARFKTLEEVEMFNKTRAKMATTIKPSDLGLDEDLESVKRLLLADKLKKVASKNKKDAAGKHKGGRSGGGSSRGEDGEGPFDYDDGEAVWRVADDDEGIRGKDLNDFEDTGDWAGGKDAEFLSSDEDKKNKKNGDDDDDDINNDSSDDSTDDDGDDDGGNAMGRGPKAPTKRLLDRDGYDDDSKQFIKKSKTMLRK
jgi:hypothetical protein